MYQVVGDCSNWNDPDSGSERVFLAALTEFSEQFRRPEIKDAPWVLWGHSGGSSWSTQMIVRHPGRVLAASFRGGCSKQFGVPEFRSKFLTVARELPMIFIWGKRESVSTSKHYVSWEPMNAMYRELRSEGGKVCRVIDPRSEHGCDDSRLMSISFFDAVLCERASRGVLADTNDLTLREWNTANRSNSTFTWLPGKNFAFLWKEFSLLGTLKPTQPNLEAPSIVASRLPNGLIRLNWHVAPALDGGLRGLRVYRDGELWKELGVRPEAFIATSRDSTPESLREFGATDESSEPHTYSITYLDGAGNESPHSQSIRIP